MSYVNRPVTERDMRDPKFPKTTDPSEYEFRGDGCIVRKDRWEVAVKMIASVVGIDLTKDEIPLVVERVEEIQRTLDEANAKELLRDFAINSEVGEENDE